MFYAFGRLIFIALAASLALALLAVGLRSSGLQQPYSEFHHPLVTSHPWIVADGGDLDQGPAQSLTALLAAHKISSEILLGLKIRLSRDGVWVLYGPTQLQDLTTGQGHVNQYTVDELKHFKFKNSNEQILTLKEALLALPQAKFFIDIIQPANPILEDLYSQLKENKIEEHVVLTSPFMDTLHQVRDKSPLWLTGTSTSELSKAQFMTSLYLEPSMELLGEVVILDKIAPRLLTELFRRHKIVLFATDNENDYRQEELAHKELGILTTRPSHFVQKVDSRANSN